MLKCYHLKRKKMMSLSNKKIAKRIWYAHSKRIIISMITLLGNRPKLYIRSHYD